MSYIRLTDKKSDKRLDFNFISIGVVGPKPKVPAIKNLD
tara:strand:+ start:128 stop:244 length:117 start_codon:yes stop_codon:yes gene_type:complete